jgi:heme exporter protein D
MDRITNFLSMGGYAEFVWPAFAVTIAVMAALVLFSWRALLADRRTLESLESVRKSLRRARKATSEPIEEGPDNEA